MESLLQQEETKQLIDHKLPRYDDLPSFGIYVDQLISLVNDSINVFYMPEEKLLTSSMVNNYVKHGVVPRPEKKKYSRDHVAYLMVVCVLKKVFNIAEVDELIKMQKDSCSTEQLYNSFMDSLEHIIAEIFQGSPERPNPESTFISNSSLIQKTLYAFANKLYVQKRIAWQNEA